MANSSRLKAAISTADLYDFCFVSVLHFGHTTRSVPLPRGTDSTCRNLALEVARGLAVRPLLAHQRQLLARLLHDALERRVLAVAGRRCSSSSCGTANTPARSAPPKTAGQAQESARRTVARYPQPPRSWRMCRRRGAPASCPTASTATAPENPSREPLLLHACLAARSANALPRTTPTVARPLSISEEI